MSAVLEAKPSVTLEELKAIVDRSKDGTSEEERELLFALIESYGVLLAGIRDKNATMSKLRDLLFGTKTETKRNVARKTGKPPKDESDKSKEKEKPKGHGRNRASDYTGAANVEIPHKSHRPGDPCPVPFCKGTLYGNEPIVFVRVCGCPPFAATVYKQERLRCGLCGRTFHAELPPELNEGKKFDETVTSMLGVLRYGYGLPMNRIENLQASAGVPLPATTQWDLLDAGAKELMPVFQELIRQAAQGTVVMNDDTVMTILAHAVKEKERKDRGEKPKERTGTFTSGIVSKLEDSRQAVLYFTGRKHAGENLARVLAERNSSLPAPTQMCDGLSRNKPKGCKTDLSNCLTHGRRQFVDVAQGFPAEVEHVIDEIALIYKHEQEAEGMSPLERLILHQERSAPVMSRLKVWMESQLLEKKIEPNSGLGKAMKYCLKRWEELTLFLRVPGAPIDNNLTERMLKQAIRHRRNSLFYKTEKGAAVGDLYMSLIATAKLALVDPFEYLNELQRHPEEIANSPGDWMPWTYKEALARSSKEP